MACPRRGSNLNCLPIVAATTMNKVLYELWKSYACPETAIKYSVTTQLIQQEPFVLPFWGTASKFCRQIGKGCSPFAPMKHANFCVDKNLGQDYEPYRLPMSKDVDEAASYVSSRRFWTLLNLPMRWRPSSSYTIGPPELVYEIHTHWRVR